VFLPRIAISGAFVFGVLFLGVPAGVSAAVHAGDELQVTVYDHSDLSGVLTVDDAGGVSMPLAGTVHVRGLQPRQIARRIEVALEPYVIEPAVDVQLKAQFSAIFVSGGPGGVLKLQPGEKLDAAVTEITVHSGQTSGPSAPGSAGDAASGDVGPVAAMSTSAIDTDRVGLLRDGRKIGTFNLTALSDKGESGPTLQPGDTLVLVTKPLAVRVEGEVRTPGRAHLRDDEPLSDAIAQRGGLLPSAAISHIVLERRGVAKLLALGDPAFSQPAMNGDTLTIPYAPHVVLAGRVQKPGPVALTTNFTLLNALYEAGGPADWADLKHVEVIDNSAKQTYDVSSLVHGDTSQNPELKNGDMVFVPEGHKFDAKGVFQTILAGAAGLVLLVAK
jgi:protein involved in polysaccharide export with SLBB domain